MNINSTNSSVNNSGCPLKMSDGRPFTDYRPRCAINADLMTDLDKNNMIKLPVTVKGRSGTDEYGCDNVYNGDTVYVEGYNDAFKVTAYDNNVMRYLPSSL